MYTSTLGGRLVRGISSIAMALLTVSAGAVHAVACGDTPLDITLRYDVTTRINQPIENIVSWNTYDCNAGGSGIYTVGGNGGSFSDYFPKSSSNKPLTGLMIGTTHDLVGDAEGQEHLVLMTNNAWASSVAGIAFGTLFPTILEEDVIAALHVYATSNVQSELEAAVAVFGGFVFGQLNSAFFNLGAVIPGTTTTSNFSVVAFSDGAIIGTGIANLTTAFPDAPVVPVPGVAMLLLAGFAGLSVQRKISA